eukprot:1161593-Pelagomonas_calceolata.AAC.20
MQEFHPAYLHRYEFPMCLTRGIYSAPRMQNSGRLKTARAAPKMQRSPRKDKCRLFRSEGSSARIKYKMEGAKLGKICNHSASRHPILKHALRLFC